MSENAVVVYASDAGVGRITIRRPEKLNALNKEVLLGVGEALGRARDDEEAGAVILTGAGDKAFVAGADIKEMAELSPHEARHFARLGQSLGEAIDAVGKPVIAAIEGFALGGGCEIALMCHLRVAGARARFGQPEVGLGLIPGFGGTQRLSRLVGEGRALETILSCEMISAETALAWGLVNRLATERSALEEAQELATTIAGKGPRAVGYSIDAVRKGLQMPLGEALEYEATLFGLTFATEDMQEGTAAFLEKRRPEFKGR